MPNTDLAVTDKYNGEVVCRVAMADEAAIDRAIDAMDAQGRKQAVEVVIGYSGLDVVEFGPYGLDAL